MAITKITEGSGQTKITGDEDAVILRSREPRKSGGSVSTVDTWGGTIDAINEYFNELVNNRWATDISVTHQGKAATLQCTWAIDFEESAADPYEEGAPDEDPGDWYLSPIEVPTALAAHPYFQSFYRPTSGLTGEDVIARAEHFIANGEDPLADIADLGIENERDETRYEAVVGRYYALRLAGVSEYPQYGMELQHSFETEDEDKIKDLLDTMGRVVDLGDIGPPDELRNLLGNMETIDTYETTDPDSAIRIAEGFEWLRRPPRIRVNTDGDKPVYTVEDTCWGLERWSAVLYGGSWDPPTEGQL